MYPRHGTEGQGLCFRVGTKAQLRGYSGRERKWEEEGKKGKKKGDSCQMGKEMATFRCPKQLTARLEQHLPTSLLETPSGKAP